MPEPARSNRESSGTTRSPAHRRPSINRDAAVAQSRLSFPVTTCWR
jgi:hypothetical protein